jgi:membrane-bound serine protease (ClpP class)
MLRKIFFGLILAFATMLVALAKEETQDNSPRAAILEIKGAIGPATAQYLNRGFKIAHEQKVDLIILEMNTPGGLVTSTREIVTEILTAKVPVAVYVSPAGAHAASAGTYILYAGHVAAMTPGTNVGAATPVQMNGPGAPGKDSEKKKDLTEKILEKLTEGKKKDTEETENPKEKEGSDKNQKSGKVSNDTADEPDQKLAPDDPMKSKMVNDLVAYIKSLAQLRNRNVEWAEKAVREAASLPSKEALEIKVIDLTARDMGELLEKIDGRVVELGKTNVTIRTKGMVTERIKPDWQMKFLSVITNPNVAFILMLIGIYGILFEFWHPGLVGPGVIGGICLLLGLYAMNILPLNYTGAGLVLLGLAFMTAEAFLPSFGILGIGGLIGFVFGATLLFDAESPEFRLSWPVIISTSIFCGLLFIIVLGFAWRSMRKPATSGTGTMIGNPAEILEWAKGEGLIWADGERWKAVGDAKFKKGQNVEIKKVDGLNVVVGEPSDQSEQKD